MKDPIFGLFDIPGYEESRTLFRKYLKRRPEGVLSFQCPAAQFGLYPICYRPAQADESPHTHRFLELATRGTTPMLSAPMKARISLQGNWTAKILDGGGKTKASRIVKNGVLEVDPSDEMMWYMLVRN